MDPRALRLERAGARALLAIVVLLAVGLGGCATDLVSRPRMPSTEAAPYAGVFTGEFVDGKPLYRFPTIEVVGTRSSVAPGT